MPKRPKDQMIKPVPIFQFKDSAEIAAPAGWKEAFAIAGGPIGGVFAYAGLINIIVQRPLIARANRLASDRITVAAAFMRDEATGTQRREDSRRGRTGAREDPPPKYHMQ
jgi:hypothetical protein